MLAQQAEIISKNDAETYLTIKDANFSMLVLSTQILAGSMISNTCYEHVVFSDCTFYGTSFRGVTFKDCIFENCIFMFTHFMKCKFVNCNFNHSIWTASSAQRSIFEHCDLEAQIDECLIRGDNDIKRAKDDHSTDIYIELATAC